MKHHPIVPHQGLLLVLPVPLYQQGDRLFYEVQASNGLERWADHFGTVTLAAPLLPESLAETPGFALMAWKDTATLSQPERFQFVPLPYAYTLPTFLSAYAQTRARLAELIANHCYLQFAFGALIGDWAAIAALEAYRQNRDYALHADWVAHEVLLRASKTARWQTRLKALVTAPLMKMYHRKIIQPCQLGLWHGADCYSAYGSLCRHSFSIHNTHTKSADLITATELAAKVDRCRTEPVLKICYAGRMTAMKAPIDWIRAVGQARDRGVNIHATWIGEGPLRREMEAAIHKLGLSQHITLLGFERDRGKLLQQIRDAHVMLFTHVTPESPRCLIEALNSGTPIVGYRSSYPEELIATSGGGTFVSMGDWQQLGKLLSQLGTDRSRLSELTQQAALSGRHFTDEVVFAERSELIKRYLSPGKINRNNSYSMKVMGSPV